MKKTIIESQWTHITDHLTQKMTLPKFEGKNQRITTWTPLLRFAPCHHSPFCPTPIYFENNVSVLSKDGCMSNVKSHCLTNILTNKNHQSLNFIPHYFIAKTAFFQTKILQLGPLKTVDMHYLPNMRLIADKTIAQKRAFIWLFSGPRIFRININTTEFWLILLLAPTSVLPHPTLVYKNVRKCIS